MCVGGDLLVGGDVVTVPVEEPDEGSVDKRGEDWRVDDGLPHGCRGKDRLAAEEEEQKSRA